MRKLDANGIYGVKLLMSSEAASHNSLPPHRERLSVGYSTYSWKRIENRYNVTLDLFLQTSNRLLVK